MDKEFYTTGVWKMDKESSGYSYFVFTNMTDKLNGMYGITPGTGNHLSVLTDDSHKKLLGAQAMHNIEHEIGVVIDYFSRVTRTAGEFAAVAYKDIPANVQRCLEATLQKSYIRTFETDIAHGKPMTFVELTDKLSPIN